MDSRRIGEMVCGLTCLPILDGTVFGRQLCIVGVTSRCLPNGFSKKSGGFGPSQEELRRSRTPDHQADTRTVVAAQGTRSNLVSLCR